MAQRDQTDETHIAALLRTRMQEISEKHGRRTPPVTIQILRTLFPLGDNPNMRLACYLRLVESYQTYGEVVARQVWRIAGKSYGKRDPGRWFTVAILRELEQRDLLRHLSEPSS